MPTPPALPWRNAVLTGACSGLGQALARELIAGGAQVAQVALAGLDASRLAALARGREHIVLPRRQARKPRPGEPGATPVPGLPPRRGDNAGP